MRKALFHLFEGVYGVNTTYSVNIQLCLGVIGARCPIQSILYWLNVLALFHQYNNVWRCCPYSINIIWCYGVIPIPSISYCATVLSLVRPYHVVLRFFPYSIHIMVLSLFHPYHFIPIPSISYCVRYGFIPIPSILTRSSWGFCSASYLILSYL